MAPSRAARLDSYRARLRSVAPHPAPSLYAVPKGVVGHNHRAVEARVGHGAGVVIPQPRLQRPPFVRVPVFAHDGVDHHLPRRKRTIDLRWYSWRKEYAQQGV